MNVAYQAASRAVHELQAAGTGPWRTLMTMRGRDVTLEASRRSCLVVAPHPDDETLGCGATIARKVDAAAPVWVLIATDGRHSHDSAVIPPEELGPIRTEEARSACRVLGLPDQHLRQLCWEDSRLGERQEELDDVILSVLREVRPAEVLVPSARDWHPDHQSVNRAARVALARDPALGARLLEYPIWHWAEGPWLRHGRRPLTAKIVDVVREPWATMTGSRPELVASGPYLDRKRAALACYRSQLQNLSGEQTWAVFDQRFLNAFLRRYELFLPAG